MDRNKILVLCTLLLMTLPIIGRGEEERLSGLQEKRPFTLDDALSLEVLNFNPKSGISPDGKRVAVAEVTKQKVMIYLGASYVRLDIYSLDGKKTKPIFSDKLMSIPLMLVHGTKDYCVQFRQAEEMYYGLRNLGKTALLVAYPDEDHLGNGTAEWVIRDFWKRALSWYDKYLM